MNSFAKEWKAIGQWVKDYQGGLKDPFYSSPASEIGEWVLMKRILKGSVVSKVGQSGRIEVSFEGPTCVKNVKTYPHPAINKEFLNDSHLRDFVLKNKKGVIYVWSPRMTLSEKGISEITAAVKKLKLPLLVLMDKGVSYFEQQELKKKIGKVPTERIDSLELKMRKVGQHFPALLVFSDSRIHSEVKYGYEKRDRYQSDLLRLLSKGK